MDGHTGFGDYIVYVDESGDHGLRRINPEYPVFVLAFCILRKADYFQTIVPAIQALKFKYFGHDMVILHEADIRKSHGDFKILLNSQVRHAFLADLSELIRSAPFTLVASCILKEQFLHRRGVQGNPYHVAMEFGLERVFLELQQLNQRGRKTFLIFEYRGEKSCLRGAAGEVSAEPAG